MSVWYRCFQSLFERPSVSEAVASGFNLNHPGESVRISECQPLALVLHPALIAFVVVLLSHGGPFAVIFSVPLVVVFALKCHPFGRPRPHIFEKIRKIGPAITNRNAAATVKTVPRAFRVEASVSHRDPRVVCKRSPNTSGLAGVAVLDVALSELAMAKAPAGFCFSVPESETGRDRQAPARAPAMPPSIPIAVAPGLSQNSQATKNTPGHIFDWHRAASLIRHRLQYQHLGCQHG